MRELTTDHKQIEGTTPYQPRLFIRVNGQRNIRLFGYPVRPRTIGLGLLCVVALVYGLARVVLGGRW